MRNDGRGPETQAIQWSSPDGQLGIHHFRYKTGSDLTWLPHTHPEYNVLCCISGNISFLVGDRNEALLPGDVLVINPGEVHCGRYGSPTEVTEGFGLHLAERWLHELLARMQISFDPRKNSIAPRGQLGSFAMLQIRELLRELDERRKGFELVLESGVAQILVDVFRTHFQLRSAAAPRRSAPQLPSWEMVDAIEYMSTHGKSEFSLADLCSTLGTSPSRFSRLFKSSARMMNPHVYYNEMLIARAKTLLHDPERSIKAIAHELGFRNDSHFCRLFRSISGMSPQRYRSSGARAAPENRPAAAR